jgi:methanogenic corrinoid protein MtbC1
MTPKEQMLAAARGTMPDSLPFAPRIDLWFSANKERGTLPDRYRDAPSADDIALGEGWALHKVVLEFMGYGQDAIIDRILGIYRIPTQGFITQLPLDVERIVDRQGDEYHVTYVTPKGAVSGCFVFTDEMRRSGISVPWIKEHILKGAGDYAAIGYLFEHMQVLPAYEDYQRWADGIGEAGMPVAYALTSGSPMHHIMKILVDSTDFYYRHRDQEMEVVGLAEQIGVYFRKVFAVVSQSPADVALIGANFDDMLTYAPFFERHILPWLQEAAAMLHARKKLMLCHTDGENQGLMDLLYESGMDIADAVCPHPMTKVTVGEYYRRWGDRVTIFGGIPSNLLLRETTSDETFEKYMETLFPAIAPGARFILGIADTTPPDAEFSRLQRIQELVMQRGKLPLPAAISGFRQKGAAVPELGQIERVGATETGKEDAEAGDNLPFCGDIRAAVMAGDSTKTLEFVRQAMALQVDPEQLLARCLLVPMDVIGEKFTEGTVFIPEVLLSARALNEAMRLVEPALVNQRGGHVQSPLVLLGTVRGDMHDIGKNLVGIMLRSVGFRVKDLGVNVAVQTFVDEVAVEKPDILALSALLTTTMPEFKKVIEGLAKAGLRDLVKVLVGGAPVTEQYASTVGADAYGADAGQAAAKARLLCQKY